MSKNLSNIFCELLPYKKENLFSVLSGKQAIGWQIKLFNLPDVWKFSQGESVKVAVLDTGIDLDHEDLKENIIEGVNFVNPNDPPSDKCGHGTHCAGIIAASNNETGIVGVAPKAKIMPVKVLDDNGNGNMETVLKGLRWAGENNADLICMSLGTSEPVEEIRKEIEELIKNKTVVFVAAGNAGNTEHLLYPAAYSETISIGAIDENCLRADFSCTGPNLDFIAPGVKIYSTIPENTYSFMSGTSMACPFAVGVAALVLSSKRQFNKDIRLCPDQYRDIFKTNALPAKNIEKLMDNKGPRFWQGMGIINPSEFTDWVTQRNFKEIKQKIKDLCDFVNKFSDKEMLRNLTEEKSLLENLINNF